MENNESKGNIIIDHSIITDRNGKTEKAKVVDKNDSSTTVNLQLKQYLEIGGASFVGGFLASLLANWIM